jgi:hypothetical protein
MCGGKKPKRTITTISAPGLKGEEPIQIPYSGGGIFSEGTRSQPAEILGNHYSTLYPPLPYTSLSKMAKGKNHDRKANPDFGKTKGKSAASSRDGEFTLKRVKGEFNCHCVDIVVGGELTLVIRRKFLPRCEKGVQDQDAQRR